MATNGASASTEASLDKIKRQLASNSGRNLLQGPLLKRSETLRKWNERWVILDPSTGKMEYRIRRNEPNIKGTIVFDASSMIALSPVNFQGLPKYDGCCIYIGTPQKMEYFLCAETPGAAKAWVSTLHATQLVLKAHKEAVNSLSGSGSAQLGTVATVVAAANATALEASKEVEAAMKISLRNALGSISIKSPDTQMDDAAIMKETLRVKDEELQKLARELRARDSAIKELTEKLSETAQAAEDAAFAAHRMDDQRRIAYAEKEQLKEGYEKQLESTMAKLRESEEKVTALSKEMDQLIKQRDSVIQEAHLWRGELGKTREHNVKLEASVVRAEDKVRMTETDFEARVKEATQRESTVFQEKEELLSYVNALKMQLQRQQVDTKQVSWESHSNMEDTSPLTKHMDSSNENVDKERLDSSRAVPLTEDGAVHLSEAGPVNVHLSNDGQWNDIQTTESMIPDVREVGPNLEGRRLDITVVSSPLNELQDQGGAFSQN